MKLNDIELLHGIPFSRECRVDDSWEQMIEDRRESAEKEEEE